jgi:hypothetical protein
VPAAGAADAEELPGLASATGTPPVHWVSEHRVRSGSPTAAARRSDQRPLGRVRGEDIDFGTSRNFGGHGVELLDQRFSARPERKLRQKEKMGSLLQERACTDERGERAQRQ